MATQLQSPAWDRSLWPEVDELHRRLALMLAGMAILIDMAHPIYQSHPALVAVLKLAEECGR